MRLIGAASIVFILALAFAISGVASSRRTQSRRPRRTRATAHAQARPGDLPLRHLR